MKQSTASRRLVKSPPELWAEVSSEDSLGRRLAEFGEIRITRVVPETTVAWEGDRASGTVELTPTGWGTKVLLTATPAAAPPERPPAAAGASGSENGPPADGPAGEEDPREKRRSGVAAPTAPVPSPDGQIAPRDEVAATSAPGRIGWRAEPERAASPAPPPDEAPRGFFARLFRRRKAGRDPGLAPPTHAPAAATPAPQASAAAIPAPGASIPGPPAPTPDPAPPTPTPDPGPLPPPAPDPAPPTPTPEPPAPQIEALDPDRAVAILTEVLDDLGAAHHRPFSRD